MKAGFKGTVKLLENDILNGTICNYLVKNLLGEGSFGEVFRCIKLDTNENVAVKMHKIFQEAAAEREEKAMKQLNNLDLDKCNFVKYYDMFLHRGNFCIAMEMLDMDLHQLIVQRSFKPLPLFEIRVILQQMLVALTALKSLGLVHADIKPDNIMLVRQSKQPLRVKLIDFTFAAPPSKIKHGAIIQALGYRATETILGLPVNESADMWSLGCVAAFLFLGRHLYPVMCEYKLMRVIVQMNGQPDKDMLDNGLYTKWFFCKTEDSMDKWTLNTPVQYKAVTGKEVKESNISNKYTCLDDLTQDHPQPKTDSKQKDIQAFLSLLKRMLCVNPAKRIAPTEGLGHRFVTMSHLGDETTLDYYVKLSHISMKMCPRLDSDKELTNFVTSSEDLHRAACSNRCDTAKTTEKQAPTGKPQCPNLQTFTVQSGGNPDESSCGNDKVNSHTNGDTTESVAAKTRKAALKGKQNLFRMIRSICCCIPSDDK